MDKMNLDKKRIITISLAITLLIGLVSLVILVQQQQNIRSKATSLDAYNALDVTDNAEKPLQYKDENGVRTYETESLDVKVRVRDLQKLIDETQP